MRIIVTGGGTGGHIYPAISVAKGLLAGKNDCKILYVGTRLGMEAGLVPENGLDFRGISGQGLPRRAGLDTIRAAGSGLKALWETKQILRDFKPDLVFGTGGYVSGPVVLTAAIFGIPSLIHEQNVLPGKTNQFLARIVKKVLLSFPESTAHFGPGTKTEVVGLPVREEIGKIDRKTGAAALGVNPQLKTILITGGSRGALNINRAAVTVLSRLEKNAGMQIIWATGSATHAEIMRELAAQNINVERPGIKILEYIQHMPEALACSDLCICRAGAATLAELSAAGKAGILVPYPFAAENHQEYNARVMEAKGAAQVILDKNLNGEILWDTIDKIISNNFILEEMGLRSREVFRPGALDRIIEQCLESAWQ